MSQNHQDIRERADKLGRILTLTILSLPVLAGKVAAKRGNGVTDVLVVLTHVPKITISSPQSRSGWIDLTIAKFESEVAVTFEQQRPVKIDEACKRF